MTTPPDGHGPAAHGPAQTGPAQTGPAQTGSAQTGPGTDWHDPGHPHPRHHTRNERMVFVRGRGAQERLADLVTSFAGSMPFVYLHALWFTVWILINEGAFGSGAQFDPFPFGLLTMIVSLEAIFLSTFVMISQNREAERQNVRADIDFETNVRAEVWSMFIGRQLGVDPDEVEHKVALVLEKAKAGDPAPTR